MIGYARYTQYIYTGREPGVMHKIWCCCNSSLQVHNSVHATYCVLQIVLQHLLSHEYSGLLQIVVEVCLN